MGKRSIRPLTKVSLKMISNKWNMEKRHYVLNIFKTWTLVMFHDLLLVTMIYVTSMLVDGLVVCDK
jgi:hypothetical protein